MARARAADTTSQTARMRRAILAQCRLRCRRTTPPRSRAASQTAPRFAHVARQTPLPANAGRRARLTKNTGAITMPSPRANWSPSAPTRRGSPQASQTTPCPAPRPQPNRKTASSAAVTGMARRQTSQAKRAAPNPALDDRAQHHLQRDKDECCGKRMRSRRRQRQRRTDADEHNTNANEQRSSPQRAAARRSFSATT